MSEGYGSFSSNPKTEWISETGNDRRMKLLEEFWYEDSSGKRWYAPAGSTIDGASIPAPLWSTVGSPYSGEYRRASIVHDVACEDAGVSRHEADKMFYFACLAGGCAKRQARLLYIGVRIGAWIPNIRIWSLSETRLPSVTKAGFRSRVTAMSEQAFFSEVASELEDLSEDTPFEDIEKVVDKSLEAKSRQ